MSNELDIDAIINILNDSVIKIVQEHNTKIIHLGDCSPELGRIPTLCGRSLAVWKITEFDCNITLDSIFNICPDCEKYIISQKFGVRYGKTRYQLVYIKP